MLNNAELPKGWEAAKTASICNTVESGFACNKSNKQIGGYVHLRTNNVGLDGKLNLTNIFEINPKLVNGKKSKIFNVWHFLLGTFYPSSFSIHKMDQIYCSDSAICLFNYCY